MCWCGGRNEFVTFLEQCLHSGVPFDGSKCAKSWQGRWFVRYGIVLVILLWSALEFCSLVVFVCIRFILFCTSQFVQLLRISWQARCLLIFLEKDFFQVPSLCYQGRVHLRASMCCTSRGVIFRGGHRGCATLCIPQDAPRNGLDIHSCVTAAKHECRSSFLFCILLLCAMDWTFHILRLDYQT